MKVLLYSTASEAIVERAKTVLQSSVSDGIEVYRTINDLSLRLRGAKDTAIVILLVGNREDFLDLLAIRHLFRNIRIIVVVPDTEHETIAMAHRLRPRYLTYIDGNFLGLSAVVNKMSEGYAQP
jgi:hypothetical protein